MMVSASAGKYKIVNVGKGIVLEAADDVSSAIILCLLLMSPISGFRENCRKEIALIIRIDEQAELRFRLGCDQTNMSSSFNRTDTISHKICSSSLSNLLYYFLEILSGLIPFIDPQ